MQRHISGVWVLQCYEQAHQRADLVLELAELVGVVDVHVANQLGEIVRRSRLTFREP